MNKWLRDVGFGTGIPSKSNNIMCSSHSCLPWYDWTGWLGVSNLVFTCDHYSAMDIKTESEYLLSQHKFTGKSGPGEKSWEENNGWPSLRELSTPSLKGDQSKDASWPDNVENVANFHVADFTLFCFQSGLLGAHPCWFTLSITNKKQRNVGSWYTYILLPYILILALFMTSVTQTAGHKMEAFPVLLSQLLNVSF